MCVCGWQQGAIGIQCRSDDERSLKYLAALNHPDTKVRYTTLILIPL
jgi:porphobilinogen deaminase